LHAQSFNRWPVFVAVGLFHRRHYQALRNVTLGSDQSLRQRHTWRLSKNIHMVLRRERVIMDGEMSGPTMGERLFG
jgi:hypothetical protein